MKYKMAADAILNFHKNCHNWRINHPISTKFEARMLIISQGSLVAAPEMFAQIQDGGSRHL